LPDCNTGHPRRMPSDFEAQWFGLHTIALDSKGNIYTGEVFAGERVQRFVPAR